MAEILTPQQHRFVAAIVSGKTQIEAYLAAGYAKGRKQTEEQLRKAAHEVAQGSRVLDALARARAAAADRLDIDVDTLVAMLLESREIALEQDPPQVNASVAAVMGVGKLLGLSIDRKQVLIAHAKPGLTSQAVELSHDEWVRQFAPESQQAAPRRRAVGTRNER